MKKKKLLLPFLLFSCIFAAAKQPPAVPLPAHPELADEILTRKEMLQEHIEISPIVWDMNWHTGIQRIKLTHPSSVLGINTDLAEIIYTTNQYKGAVISVDVRPLFTIYSNLSVGFLSGHFPRDFSVDNLPYRSNEWVSLESDSYVAKKFFLQKDVTLAPYSGYTFSQYQLTPMSQLSKKEEKSVRQTDIMLTPVSKKTSRLCGSTKRYIDTHYQENITLQDLAHWLALSPSRICHRVTEHFGKPFTRLLLDLRLEKSCRFFCFCENVSDGVGFSTLITEAIFFCDKCILAVL